MTTDPLARELYEGITQGDIRSLSRGITLIESTLEKDMMAADSLMDQCAEFSGKSHRLGITGVPGVGKSTFIESLGLRYCEAGHRVAVLAIDPSSLRTGGAILGDKTRMEKLASHPHSFIRPSAASNTLGGVARKTRESIILCEAAGFDRILIETVGVGQSETQVRMMVDTFVLLMLAGAGDELQGIKRGIMEMADILLINKVEEESDAEAREAISDYRSALHLLGSTDTGWNPGVWSVSSLTGRGMDQVESAIQEHWEHLGSDGSLQKLRQAQDLNWFEEALREELFKKWSADRQVGSKLEELKEAVKGGEISPLRAARKATSD
ncbi:MAG: methylmalonyl Co-A mutase-associated GTPase MeaB [Flavobacteriales bacterium]|nr:methylmalonyl Co-A mutase-associated GTPase MeaB [Flavobacteriales bacterium]